MITDQAISESSTGIAKKGDLLLVTRTSLGKAAVVPSSLICFSQDITAVRTNPEKLDARYLWHYIRSQASYFANRARGATIKGVTRDVVRHLPIPLAPLPEQRLITRILNHVDSLRAKRREAIALLNELSQSIFLDMFGDPVSNPRAWTETKLGDMIVDNPKNGLYKPQKFYGSGYPIVRIDSFYSGKLIDHGKFKRVSVSDKEAEQYFLKEGDILINRVNSLEYLGKSALVEGLSEPTLYESNMMRFSVDRKLADPAFVNTVLQSGHIKGQIASAAKKAVNQASINQSDVKSLSFYLPPLDLQREFVRRNARIHSHKVTMLNALAELDALFASLQHRAFRGELWTEEITPVA